MYYRGIEGQDVRHLSETHAPDPPTHSDGSDGFLCANARDDNPTRLISDHLCWAVV